MLLFYIYIYMFIAPVPIKKTQQESSSEEESSEDEVPATVKPTKTSKLFSFYFIILICQFALFKNKCIF